MFFKKTEDYGETWTSDGGYKNSGYHFIPDEVMMELTDSLWTMYSENADDSAYATKLWYLEPCVIRLMKNREIL